MIASKKRFFTALGILAVFTALLVIMFLPLFNGQNMLRNIDELYNSISKGSANYLSEVRETSEECVGISIDTSIDMESQEQAEQTALLYEGCGAEAVVSGDRMDISGDLGHNLATAVGDAEKLYGNNRDELSDKYGYDGLQVMYNWHRSLVSLNDVLEREGMVSAAKAVAEVAEKGIEPAYNYFGIEPEKMSEKAGVVVGSLFFYVFYTVLWGFGIMYLFEAWGLKATH